MHVGPFVCGILVGSLIDVSSHGGAPMPSHEDVVRRSFTNQVHLFTGPNAPFAMRSGELAWIQPLHEDMIVLEVACGAAHAAQSVAPHVRLVVGIDLTRALLDLGSERLRADGISNVVLEEANAERLPFVDESFDVVFCRSSLHHFSDPLSAVAEMVRVCRRAGRIVLVDLVAPTSEVRTRFDAVHRLLDPSHVRSFVEEELAQLLPGGIEGLTYASTLSIRLPVDVAFTEESTADGVTKLLRAEIDGDGAPTGLLPEAIDGSVTVTFSTCIVHGARP